MEGIIIDNNNIFGFEGGLIRPPLSISTIKNNNNNIFCEYNGATMITQPQASMSCNNNNNDNL